MKIINTGRYALSFDLVKNGRTVKFAFDRRRVFLDTGNVATTGITEISDEDYAELKKNKHFVKCFEDGSFAEITDEQLAALGDTSAELKAKDKALEEKEAEIKSLKAKLNKDKASKELEAKDKEIASLKKQLESLTANKDEEGF